MFWPMRVSWSKNTALELKIKNTKSDSPQKSSFGNAQFMKDRLVSVIIPAYKAGLYIEETVRAVLAQTHQNLELFIIDDGSPDDQAKTIKPLVAKDPRVHYIKQKNGGVSSARNHGYRLSKGTFIAFLDADDTWLPNNLELKLAKFGTDNRLGLVHSDMAIMDSQSILTGATKQGKEGYILDDLLAWNGTCIPTPSSILVKKEVLEKVGGFDLALSNAADQEFFFRVAKHFKIGRVDAITWHYRVHENNMHSNIAVMEKDALLAYQKADELQLFKSKKFRNFCFATMYLIVAASWWGDGKNKVKGLKFAVKALFCHPPIVLRFAKRIFS
jgi:glycosyltransferase involved in cell wall biosynthesis